MSDHDEMANQAARAVREAAQLSQRVQTSIDYATLQKSDNSPVTVADYGCQALVAHALRTASPEIPLVGEEDSGELAREENQPLLAQVVEQLNHHIECSARLAVELVARGKGDGASNRFWTLDPIDGTKGFVRGEQYAIALALVENGTPVIAALACPNFAHGTHSGIVLVAVKGAGTRIETLAGEDLGIATVSQVMTSAQASLCESVESGHSDQTWSVRIAQKLAISRPALRLDSQAKYAAVATGAADLYLRLPTRADYVERIWDHAAGSLVVSEAGGRITDVAGNTLDFSVGRGLANNRGAVASNGHFHDAILEAIALSA